MILAAGLLALAQHPASAQLPTLDLSVTKTDSPDPLVVGENLTYTVVAKNNDLLLSATGVTVSDTLPANTTFVSVSSTKGSCAESGGTVTCNIGDLAASTSATVTIVVKPASTAPNTISNTATVTANEPELDTANNSDTEETTINHHAPDAVGDAATTDEDSAVTLNVLANDSDLDGDLLTLTNNSGAASGQASCTNAGSCTYTPNADFNGTDSFQYTVSDGRNGTDTATVNITVNAVNDAPLNSVPGAQTTNEDTALVFSGANNISTSDVDVGSNAAKVTLEVTNGTLTLSGTSGLSFTAGDGTNDAEMTFSGAVSNLNAALDGLRYDPAANYNGGASLSITTDDRGHAGSGGARSDTDSVNITINAVNDAPTAGSQSVTTNEDAARTITLTSSDLDGDTLSFEITAGPTGGTLSAIGTVTCAGTAPKSCQAEVTYTPNANYYGTDSFKFRVNDGTVNGAEATVSITIDPVNDAPTVTLIGEGPVNEGRSITFDFAVSDPDSGDAFTIKSGFPNCGTEGTLAKDSLTTTATGGSFRCRFLDGPATSTVSLQVADVQTTDSNTATKGVQVNNVAPLISLTGPATADEGQTKTYSYKIIDPGDDTHTTATSCGTNGVKVAGSDTYNSATGDGGFRCRFPDGPATSGVTARVTDSDGASDSDNQLVEVQVSNVAPTLTLSGPATANEGQTKAYTYTVTDPGDDPSPAITESCGANATRIDTPAGGSFECTFAKGPASSTVSVSANDGEHTGTSSVVVNVANVAPTISNIANQTIDEGASTSPIPFSIGDAATPANALQVSGSSSNTTLVPNDKIVIGGTGANRTVKVTPAANQSGTATITVSVSDGAATASDTFLLTVRAVDTVAPTLMGVAPSGRKVSPTTKVTATFSEKMNEATVEASGAFMLKQGAKRVPATVVYDKANDRAILTPSRKLKRGATYTATMTTKVKDLAGNALAAGKVWKFRVR